MAIPTQEYLIGVKREVRDALRDVFAAMPDSRLQAVNISLEYPGRPEQYPAIFITYSEGPIRNVGIAHFELDENAQIAGHWKFHGSINFNIMAVSPFERDVIANTLVNVIAFGRIVPEFQKFHQDINDGDFVSMHLMSEEVAPGGESVVPTPWEAGDEQLYNKVYSSEIFGEFFTDPYAGGLITISKIRVFPYTEDMEVPQGSNEPEDVNIPWI